MKSATFIDTLENIVNNLTRLHLKTRTFNIQIIKKV